MSWSRPRRRALLAALIGLSLAGCGLHPLHGGAAGPQLNGALAGIQVKTPDDRIGLFLKNELTAELDPGALDVAPTYDLQIDLKRISNAVAIQLNATITRYDLTLAASFRLRRRADDKVLFSSATRRVASYNIVEQPYSILISEQDAEKRAAIELAHEIRTQVAIFLSREQAA